MSFNQNRYIAEYNKRNYKMYQFRVRKADESLIDYLDGLSGRNQYILDCLHRSAGVLTLKQIKEAIKPVLNQYGIQEIYLFGSYARGEATGASDVDILCEKGNVESLIEQSGLLGKLKEALGKEVDLVFLTSEMDEDFRKNVDLDKIKLC